MDPKLKQFTRLSHHGYWEHQDYLLGVDILLLKREYCKNGPYIVFMHAFSWGVGTKMKTPILCLRRHKAVAPQKYVELERRLKEDPRVAYAFQ